MGLLSNFIGGAASAGGEILQRERESGVRVKESQDIARFNDDLATKREQALAALRNQYQIDAEGRQVQAKKDNDAYEASPERIAQLTRAERGKAAGLIANRIELAPEAAKATAAEFAAGADTRKAAQDEKVSFALTEFRQKSAAELEADIKKLNDPQYLAGKAKEAEAGRDPNSAALARVQLQSAQIALKEKQAEAKIPPAVKGSIAAIQKQADAISAAVTKAELDGSASPEAVQKYQTRLSELNGQISKLYEPYMDKSTKPAEPEADPIKAAMDAARLKKDGAQPKPKPGAAAEPSAPAEPAPARNQGARNPYVDSKGRPLPNAPTDSGQTAWESTVKPGIVGAAAAVNQAGSNAMKTYLQEKIARNEALSPSEQVRAKQFGLVK